jgi:hypothetical protein
VVPQTAIFTAVEQHADQALATASWQDSKKKHRQATMECALAYDNDDDGSAKSGGDLGSGQPGVFG